MINETSIRTVIIALLVGVVLGAGTTAAISYSANRGSRIELAGYQSLVADGKRRIAELSAELDGARALAGQNRDLDAAITQELRESIGYINQARDYYQRSLAELQFANKIFELLRRRYDPTYKGSTQPGG